MKRCPQCGREYDVTMMFCLDDGMELLYGPASMDGPQTVILSDRAALAGGQFDDEKTRAFVHTKQREAEPQENKGGLSEKQSFSAPRAAKPLIALAVTAIVLAGVFFGYKYFGSNNKQIDSIAVMPFVNESGNADVEYLSDGMTETLIKSLSGIPNLNIKARSSVFRYKGQQSEIKKIAAELGVQAVLNGRVTQRGDEVALSLELIDAARETVLWSEQYVRKQANVVSLQNEIAKDVFANLRAKLTAADATKLAKTYTADPQAYEMYLKGQFHLNRATPESQKLSVEYFKQAVEIDPNFAQAYSAMADAYTILGTIYTAQISAKEAMPKARSAAEKALELDPALSDAYTSLAWIKFRFDWDWSAAETDFRKAIELDPKNAQAHHWYGEYLSCMGRHSEAIAEMRTARELEPFSVIISWNLGKNLYTARRDDEALAELNRSLALDSSFGRTLRLTSSIYEEKGMIKEAFAAFLKQPENIKASPEKLAELTTLFETKGITAARRKSAEWFLADAVTPAQRATAYLTLGDNSSAIKEIEKAYQERNGTLVSLNMERVWDPLKNDPGFREIVGKMKFPQTQ